MDLGHRLSVPYGRGLEGLHRGTNRRRGGLFGHRGDKPRPFVVAAEELGLVDLTGGPRRRDRHRLPAPVPTRHHFRRVIRHLGHQQQMPLVRLHIKGVDVHHPARVEADVEILALVVATDVHRHVGCRRTPPAANHGHHQDPCSHARELALN
jgi:hypothetical protein